jgi:aryl-alcohol dehydrogenase-like predicted oxidoreductase
MWELGYGMMSFAPSLWPSPDRPEAIRVIPGACERGVTFFDTAEASGPFTHEELVLEALTPYQRRCRSSSSIRSRTPPRTSRPSFIGL